MVMVITKSADVIVMHIHIAMSIDVMPLSCVNVNCGWPLVMLSLSRLNLFCAVHVGSRFRLARYYIRLHISSRVLPRAFQLFVHEIVPEDMLNVSLVTVDFLSMAVCTFMIWQILYHCMISWSGCVNDESYVMKFGLVNVLLCR